jgi:hypothetical protein
VLGARKVGSQVQFKLQWEGGARRWGTKYQSWELMEGKKAMKALGGAKGLEGKKALVQFDATIRSLAEIGQWSATRKKWMIHYPGEEDDNEFLDLIGAEKDWELVIN